MRAVLLSLLAACAPEIVPGAYFCGPNETCPEDQVCNEADNTCVLPGLGEPFLCDPDINSEPDDSVSQGFTLQNLDCSTLPVVIDNCMLEGDPADWVRLTPPSICSEIELDARITFPLAFERLGLELYDVASNATLATDTACPIQLESGDELRCLRGTLSPGVTYGIQVSPTGDGDCNGDCAFSRYTLRIQLTQ